MKSNLRIIAVLMFVSFIGACGGTTPSIGGNDALDAYESGGTLTGDPSEPNPDPSMSDGSPVIPHTNDFTGWAGSLSAALCSKFQECGLIDGDENQCIAAVVRTPGLPQAVGIPELNTFEEMYNAQRNAWFGASNGSEGRCNEEIQEISCSSALMTDLPADDGEMFLTAAPAMLMSSTACFQVYTWISDLTCSGDACSLRPSVRPITDSTTTAPVDSTTAAVDTLALP